MVFKIYTKDPRDLLPCLCIKTFSQSSADLLVDLNTSLDIDDRKRQKFIAISDLKMCGEKLETAIPFASEICC